MCRRHIATDLGLFKNYTTKESYKPSSKDTIIGYYQWAYKVKPLRGIGVATPAESALAQNNPAWMYNGRWQRTWSNRLFSEVNIGEFGYVFPEQPNVPFATNPPRHDLSSGNDSGAGWFNAAGNTGPFVLSRGKPQAYAHETYFLPTDKGSHDLKFGFEFMNDRSTNTANGTSGPILYQDRERRHQPGADHGLRRPGHVRHRLDAGVRLRSPLHDVRPGSLDDDEPR